MTASVVHHKSLAIWPGDFVQARQGARIEDSLSYLRDERRSRSPKAPGPISGMTISLRGFSSREGGPILADGFVVRPKHPNQ